MVSGLGTNDLLLSGTVAEVNRALYLLATCRRRHQRRQDDQRHHQRRIAVGHRHDRRHDRGHRRRAGRSGRRCGHQRGRPAAARRGQLPVQRRRGAGARRRRADDAAGARHGSSTSTGSRTRSTSTGDGIPDLCRHAGPPIRRARRSRARTSTRAWSITSRTPGWSGPDGFTFQVRDTGGADYGINLDLSPNIFTILVTNLIDGTPADDDLTGTPGPDIINGLGANDRMQGLATTTSSTAMTGSIICSAGTATTSSTAAPTRIIWTARPGPTR